MRPRKWSEDEKFAMVLEGIKGVKSVSEICREHQLSQTLFYKWRDRFLEAGRRGLNGGSTDENVYKAELEKLQKIIGKQAIVIDVLKKTEELMNHR